MTIDEKFASQPDSVRQTYFARALGWYIANRKGQPTLVQCKSLAASMWYMDHFINQGKDHAPHAKHGTQRRS